MVYYVYIIKNLRTGKHYTGLTKDLVNRLNQHNLGKVGTITTNNNDKYALVHAEEVISRNEARRREKFWKSGIGRELRTEIENYMGA